jgi:GAF domain-containing protein
LLDAFTAELSGEQHGAFLEALDNALRGAIRDDYNVNRWHSVLSALRRHALSCLTQSDLVIYRAEALWTQACVLVGERALQVQARQHALQMHQVQALRELRQSLTTEADVAGLLDAVADHLPRLGIRRCYLALYDVPEPVAGWARMVLAYDSGQRSELGAAGLRFPARQLLPPDLCSEWERRDLIVNTLESHGDQFGFVVFGGDSHDRTAYETLASELSIAWEGVLALQERVRTKSGVGSSTLQLETVAEVGRAATSILDPDVLMQRIVDLVRERLDLYYAGLFLVDEDGAWTGESGRWAVLRAGTGPAGQQMIASGHRLEVGGASMVGACIALGEGRIALDVGREAVRFDNPLLPDTRSELALPLVSRGRPIGAMTIQSAQSAAFTEADISALQVMADQLGNAVQNARLLEQAQARAEELAVLNEIGRTLTAPLNAQEVSTVVYEGASRLLDASNFYLALYDEDTNEVTFPFDSPERAEDRLQSLPADQGLTGYVIRSRAPLLIDAGFPERLVELGVDLMGAPALSWLGVPLLVGERVLGMMGVQSYATPYAYNRHHQDLMVALGNQAAIALQSAQLWQETQRSLVEMEALNAITRAVSGILDLDDVLRVALHRVLDLTDFDVGLISLVSPETGRLYLAVQLGLPDSLDQRLAETGMEGTLCDMVYQQGEALTVEDFAQGAPVEVGGLERLGLRSYLGVPLESRGAVLGTLCIFGYSPLSVQPAVLSLMRAVGQQVGVAVENARLYAHAQKRAERESVLREIADRMQRATDLESLMRVATEELSRTLGASRAYVRLGTEGEWADGDGQDPRSAMSEQPDGDRE